MIRVDAWDAQFPPVMSVCLMRAITQAAHHVVQGMGLVQANACLARVYSLIAQLAQIQPHVRIAKAVIF
jgi:hypothetical protein